MNLPIEEAAGLHHLSVDNGVNVDRAGLVEIFPDGARLARFAPLFPDGLNIRILFDLLGESSLPQVPNNSDSMLMLNPPGWWGAVACPRPTPRLRHSTSPI